MYKYKHVNRLDGFITLTPEIHEKVLRQGINSAKLAIIPNAIGLDSTKPKFSQHSQPVIGAIGRLAHEKGFHILIKSLGILKKRNISFKCLIGGDGPQKEELLQLAKENNVLEYLEFLGEIVDNKNFYRKVDFLALPLCRKHLVLLSWKPPNSGNQLLHQKWADQRKFSPIIKILYFSNQLMMRCLRKN